MSRKRRPTPGYHRPQQRIRALIEMRAWDAAVDEARRVVVGEPDNAQAHAYMAWALWELNRNDEALQAAEAALRCGPDCEWYHRLRGLALRGLERYEESLRCLEEAVRLAPEETRALHELLNCQSYCERWEEILETARRYERLAPDLEAPHHFRANALWALGDIKGARAAYEEALRIDSTICPQLHAHVGRLRLHEGRTADAIEAFLQSLRMRPDSAAFEAGLLYAVRHHLDAADPAPGAGAKRVISPRSPFSALATELHVLALRPKSGYWLLLTRAPPPLEYHSPLSGADVEAATHAMHVARSSRRDQNFQALTRARVPTQLARSLLEGKTAHYREGLSLDDMLRHWMVTVLDLERGYPRDSADFVHDRRVRDAIDGIAECLPPACRDLIREELGQCDVRFQAATAVETAAEEVAAGADSNRWARTPRKWAARAAASWSETGT